MRTLVLMRACPGAGKSYFIKEHNLEPYTLSADQIRLQYCSPILNLEGNYCISQRNDNIVWDKLFEMLEYRMELGCFTIIDATNSKTSEMQRYKDLCQKYRYRIYCIDMTDIPIETCKERNNIREPYKRVPEEVIDNIYSRFATQKIPSGIKVIKPSEFDEVMRFNPIDLSEYDNVYVIGDIHGVYNALQDFVNDISNNNTNKPYLTDRWLNIKNFPQEQWKDIEGYNGNYQISNYGRLKSIQRNNKNQLTNEDKICRVRENTYLYFNLSLNSQKKTYKIHQLVMEYFGTTKPFDNAEINHKDGNKLNNHIDNLEWSSRQENEQHAWENQLKNFSQSVKQFNIDGSLLKEYPSIKVAAESSGVIATSIVKCCSGQFKTAGGYRWEYSVPKELHRAGIPMAIDQFDLEGNFLYTYKSIHEAEKAVGVQSIRQVLAGKAKTAGGYCWKYHNIKLSTEQLILNSPNNFFIFCGDYSDRGTENAEMLKFLYGIKDNKNVLLLEGNHDKYFNMWGNDDITSIRSKEFLNYTMPELDYKRIFTKKMARELYRKLAQCAYFTYGNETFFVCHGGLSSIPDNLIYVPTRQMIDGVGRYSDYKEMADNYAKHKNIILVNGHRNINKLSTKVNDKCYNLEGAVEFGGNLRVLRIGKNLEKEVLEYSNKLPIAEHLVKQKTEFTNVKTENVIINDNNDNDIGKLVHELRNNKYVIEKQFGNISSFNFSREAFEKGIWDDMTVKARGLYIDTVNNRIQSRGYEKFFKVNQIEETKLPSLARTFKFPIDIFQKENGYLGLISYDYYNDDLFFTTKSTPDGDYSINFKNLFYSKVSEKNRDLLKICLKSNNYTLAVEVIDPVFDPHIIEYSRSKIVGLDLIKNTLNFEVADYMMLEVVCNQIGIDCKKKIGTLNNWEEFENFYNNAPKDSASYSDNPNLLYGKDIEGWVLKDSNGFMVKIKSDYYNMWKKLRGVAGAVIKSGNYKYTGALQNPTENYFFAWIKENWELYHYNDTLPRDIITLRKEFYNSRYGELVKK